MRVNGNLGWYGDQLDLYLRGVNPLLGDGSGNVDTSTDRSVGLGRGCGDYFISAGQRRPHQAKIHQLLVDGSGNISAQDTGSPLPTPVPDSTDFATFQGMFRDGSNYGDNSLDSNGNPAPAARGIKRIEPPLVDQPDTTNTTTRYRQLTQNSGSRVQNAGRQRVNLGQVGWGRGIYINNTNDVQDDSQTLFGGYTARYDWLKPNNPASRFWIGPYYVPPGVIITLRADDWEMINSHKQYFFTITRTDTVATGRNAGQTAVWYDAWGNPRPDWGQTDSECRIPTRVTGATSSTTSTAIPPNTSTATE